MKTTFRAFTALQEWDKPAAMEKAPPPAQDPVGASSQPQLVDTLHADSTNNLPSLPDEKSKASEYDEEWEQSLVDHLKKEAAMFKVGTRQPQQQNHTLGEVDRAEDLPGEMPTEGNPSLPSMDNEWEESLLDHLKQLPAEARMMRPPPP